MISDIPRCARNGGGRFIPNCCSRWNLCSLFLTRHRKKQDNEWYQQGMHALVSCWRKAVEVDGDHVENMVWRQIFWLIYVLLSCFWINIYCGNKNGALLSGQPRMFNKYSEYRVLLDKIIVTQLAKKFPAFYGTVMLISRLQCSLLVPIPKPHTCQPDLTVCGIP
jgi:hypothetical protein